jgi:tetratricopeptide (TPR) repeat protein
MTLRNFLKLHQDGTATRCVSIHLLPYDDEKHGYMKTYFEEAMQVKLDSVSTPLFYIDCLLNNEDYEEAKKLIEYAKGIKGIDQSRILYRKAIFFEKQEQLKKALKILEKSRKKAPNKNYLDFITERIDFIKTKIEKPKKKKSQKKDSNK